MNRGSYWKVPGWLYKYFIQGITPVAMLIVLFFTAMDNFKNGYYKWVPDFVAGNAVLIPWVQAGRIVVFAVLIFGAVQTYSAIKKTYGEELAKNEVLIRK